MLNDGNEIKDATNQPLAIPAPAAKSSLDSLTDRNWLFIKHFLATGKVVDSYRLAGYKSDVRSAPYVLFKQLKSRIEELGDLDVTSRARLQVDLNKVLDLPLASSTKELSINEWLKVRKFAASITPEIQTAKPQISVLVINRVPKDTVDVSVTSKAQNVNVSPTDSISNVIDVDPL